MPPFLRRYSKHRKKSVRKSTGTEPHQRQPQPQPQPQPQQQPQRSASTKTNNNNNDPWNDDRFQEMETLWELTPQEQKDLRDLQTQLADIHHWKNDPFEVVRYYKEYRTVSQAAHMFRRMVQWRIDHDMDTFLLRYGDPPKLFHYLPTFLCQGLDRDGDPIYVERTGASDPYGLVCAYGGIEPLAEYTSFIREITTTREAFGEHGFCWQRDYYEPLMGRRIRQFTVIMDMQGLSHRHLRGGLLGLLKRMARISQDMYAGMGKRVIILRAPSIFEWGWTHVVQHFFDQHIRDMIVFTNVGDYLQVMGKYIDLTVLPDCLAPGIGTGQAMPGYFANIHLEGGRIPSEEDYVPAVVIEPVGISNASLMDEEITLDGVHDIDKVGVKGGSLMVGVTGGCLMKGIWEGDNEEEEESVDANTQVTVVSRRSSFQDYVDD